MNREQLIELLARAAHAANTAVGQVGIEWERLDRGGREWWFVTGGDILDALTAAGMVVVPIDYLHLVQRLSELSLRESNGVRDSAVHSPHDAAVLVKQARAMTEAANAGR